MLYLKESMANIIKLKDHNTVAEIKEICKKSKDESQKTRLRVILGIKANKLKKDVAESLNLNTDTITNIVKRYNEEGADGLKTNLGGRPEGNPKWDLKIFTELVDAIDKQKGYWSIPKMIEWIKENKKEDIPYNTVWYHLQLLKCSYKSARPHPYLGDKEKQEIFKKRVSVT